MTVETLGDAHSYGWRITARCIGGVEEDRRSRRDCVYRAELDVSTLLWTRGRDFPLARLETRLKCPRCGSRRVALMFSVPPQTQRARG
jgi:hypothetical protein